MGNPETKANEWSDIIMTYQDWKNSVRYAMATDRKLKKIHEMYSEYLNNNKTPSNQLLDACIQHQLKRKRNASVDIVKYSIDDIYTDIVEFTYDLIFNVHKYEADEHWMRLTKFDKFAEFLDLISPIELMVHRGLCERDGQTKSRVYRQKPKTLVHDGAFVTTEVAWISHERTEPEIDQDEEEFGP